MHCTKINLATIHKTSIPAMSHHLYSKEAPSAGGGRSNVNVEECSTHHLSSLPTNQPVRWDGDEALECQELWAYLLHEAINLALTDGGGATLLPAAEEKQLLSWKCVNVKGGFRRQTPPSSFFSLTLFYRVDLTQIQNSSIIVQLTHLFTIAHHFS